MSLEAQKPAMHDMSAPRGASLAQAAPDSVAEPAPVGRLRVIWNGISAGIGAVMGLLPHVLHHIGFLVGAAAVTGVVGNLLFGAAGLVLSIPFLIRLRRRFGTWRAPALAVALFTGMFLVSAFVIGPAIVGGDATPATTPQPAPTAEHEGHHN